MYKEYTPDAPPINEFTGFKLSHLYNVVIYMFMN